MGVSCIVNNVVTWPSMSHEIVSVGEKWQRAREAKNVMARRPMYVFIAARSAAVLRDKCDAWRGRMKGKCGMKL